MNPKDLLKIRMQNYLSLKILKEVAAQFLPPMSGYVNEPHRFKKRHELMDALNKYEVVDNPFEEILSIVNSSIGEKSKNTENTSGSEFLPQK